MGINASSHLSTMTRRSPSMAMPCGQALGTLTGLCAYDVEVPITIHPPNHCLSKDRSCAILPWGLLYKQHGPLYAQKCVGNAPGTHCDYACRQLHHPDAVVGAVQAAADACQSAISRASPQSISQLPRQLVSLTCKLIMCHEEALLYKLPHLSVNQTWLPRKAIQVGWARADALAGTPSGPRP